MLAIETLKDKDLETTALLHEENLKLGLFPKLGAGFLQRYQAGFLDSPHGIALVARDRREGRLLGLLLGTTSNAEHYRWVMRNHGASLAASGCAALLTRPVLAAEFLQTRAMRYVKGVRNHMRPTPVRSDDDEDEEDEERSAEPVVSVLSHIVTHPDARGLGVGRKLVARFRAIARNEGADKALLVTQEGGMGAGFFERLGCALVARRGGQDGEAVREYALPLHGGTRNETFAASRRTGALAGAYGPRFGAAGAPTAGAGVRPVQRARTN